MLLKDLPLIGFDECKSFKDLTLAMTNAIAYNMNTPWSYVSDNDKLILEPIEDLLISINLKGMLTINSQIGSKEVYEDCTTFQREYIELIIPKDKLENFIKKITIDCIICVHSTPTSSPIPIRSCYINNKHLDIIHDDSINLTKTEYNSYTLFETNYLLKEHLSTANYDSLSENMNSLLNNETCTIVIISPNYNDNTIIKFLSNL